MKFNVETNALRVADAFGKFTTAIEDMTPVWMEFIPQFQNNRVGWINAQRTLDGDKYKPLSPSYYYQKYGRRPRGSSTKSDSTSKVKDSSRDRSKDKVRDKTKSEGTSPRVKVGTQERLINKRPILVDTGRMLMAVAGSGPGHEIPISKKEFSYIITVPYAYKHQDGFPETNLPQRNFFLTRKNDLHRMDYAQLIQATTGKIDKDIKAILMDNRLELFDVRRNE